MRFTEYERVKWTLGGMLFTWDDRKAASNLKKHGVRFSEAAAIFLDDNISIEINSVDEYTGEERLQAVGMVYGDINNDIIRIISARHATKEEEKYYAYRLA